MKRKVIGILSTALIGVCCLSGCLVKDSAKMKNYCNREGITEEDCKNNNKEQLEQMLAEKTLKNALDSVYNVNLSDQSSLESDEDITSRYFDEKICELIKKQYKSIKEIGYSHISCDNVEVLESTADEFSIDGSEKAVKGFSIKYKCYMDYGDSGYIMRDLNDKSDLLDYATATLIKEDNGDYKCYSLCK